MTPDELRAQIRLMLQPVDLDALVAKGVLIKSGAWYQVKNLRQLPKRVSIHISEISQDSSGRTKVKFKRVTDRQAERLRKFL